MNNACFRAASTLLMCVAACSQPDRVEMRAATRRNVVAEELVHLDDAGEPILARPERLSVGRTGRYFVTDISDRDIKVYGDDGRRVATFGRAGRGPGEFAALFTAQAYGDSLVAYDFGNQTVSVFSPGGRFARSLALDRLPFTPSGVRVVDDSLFLVSAAVPGSAGRPLLALLRPDGARISTFFNPRKQLGRAAQVIQNLFLLADGADGVIFAGLAGGDSIWAFDYQGNALGSAPIDPSQPLPTLRSLVEGNGGRMQRPDGTYVVDGQRTLFSLVALDSGMVAMQVTNQDAVRGTDLLDGGTLLVAAVQRNGALANVVRSELSGGLLGTDRTGSPLVLRYSSADQDRYAITRLRLTSPAASAPR